MAKKPMTREALLAELEALDNTTEVGKLKAEIARLTEENAALTANRDDLAKRVRQYEKDMTTIREVVRGIDRRAKPITIDPETAERTAAARRFEMAHVLHGVNAGTHDPRTGLEYTAETKPVRDLTAGAPKVTQAELASFFPALGGAGVDVTDNADAVLAAELEELKGALQIAESV